MPSSPGRLRRLALVLERRAGAAREGLRRIGPGPRLLVLDHLALRRVDEGDALGDEAADPGLASGLDQVVAALGARSVGRPVVDLPRVVLAGKAGELADHDLRRRIPHRGLHRLAGRARRRRSAPRRPPRPVPRSPACWSSRRPRAPRRRAGAPAAVRSPRSPRPRTPSSGLPLPIRARRPRRLEPGRRPGQVGVQQRRRARCRGCRRSPGRRSARRRRRRRG